jgi:LuxR family maltose regulon positive regulatory protein
VDPPLVPPRLAPDLIERSALLERLTGRGVPVALVLAPAGYGKTTLLAQWAQADARPAAWVSLSESDNDAPSFLAHLLLALDAIVPIEDAHLGAVPLSAADLTKVVLPRLGALVADAAPMLWMLDDVHVLHSDRARQILRVLVDHLPGSSMVVLAGRRAPELPIARWRASRAVVDVGVDDLVLTDHEGIELLGSSGVSLAPDVAEAIVARTEGWPAGLYLSALALREGAEVSLGGVDHRSVAEYLLEEVLRVASDEEATFLTRSAVFDVLRVDKCDAVLERSDSGALLDRFERSNLFVRSLGPGRSTYRYHQLFRDLLRAELARREPNMEAALHRRASDWWEAQGDIDRAVSHAREAGDRERAATLIWSAMPACIGSGRTATVERWLLDVPLPELVDRPALLVSAAWTAFTSDDVESTERWASILRGHRSGDAFPDGTSVGAAVALLDALLSRDGLSRSLADATRAAGDYPETSPYRPLASLLAGMAARLLGDDVLSSRWLEEAARLSVLLPPTAAQCAAQLAVVAIDAGRWDEARRLTGDALDVIDEFGFTERPAMCTVYAVAGVVRARDGRSDAREVVKHGAWLVESLHGVAPFVSIDTRILLARAFVGLGEHREARRHLVDADAMLDSYPDAGRLPHLSSELSARLAAADVPLGVFATPLTPAELRVLRYLPTHLSFGEIADAIVVSRNTVKTQAIAVYRKLGVTSRAAAVDRARAAGLIEG